ncbi:MAG: PcfJ domain-containing protein [Candidatus Poribacteria bacterium]|nr:PcfJ domain-containing protein [Candidatus Poribacteria bacterium]
MAKKSKVKPPKISIEECTLKMQAHIHQLGLSTVEDYKTWCQQHNFSRGLDKNTRQLRNELNIVTAINASEIMAEKKKARNLNEIIPKIYNGELQSQNLRKGTAKEIALAFERSYYPNILLKLLLCIEQNSDLLEDPTYIKGIEAIANHSESWISPLETWHVKRHNRDRQFAELLHHLFVAYDVPAFMNRVWLTENEMYQNWYIHIGAGQNIRTAPGIPIALTKKMAHHFLTAPKQYTVEEAIRWGQVQALGGDKRLMDALRGTRMLGNFKNDDFWLNVIRFFIANPMLDVSHVHPIIDYIWNQKFENQRVFVERGVAEEIDPPQPNFSMNGRTPKTLLRQVNEWHRQLGKATKGGHYQWPRSEIGEFHFRVGSEKKGNLRYWHIRELLSTDELIYEGRKMNHCVSSYARSCYSGKKSIWTVESEDENGRHKALTVEISRPDNLIRQVRGKRNRLPTLSEKYLLERWAAEEKLGIAEYLRFE